MMNEEKIPLVEVILILNLARIAGYKDFILRSDETLFQFLSSSCRFTNLVNFLVFNPPCFDFISFQLRFLYINSRELKTRTDKIIFSSTEIEYFHHTMMVLRADA